MSLAPRIVPASRRAALAALGVVLSAGPALAQSAGGGGGLGGGGGGGVSGPAASPRPSVGERGISLRAGVLYGSETNAFPIDAPGAGRLDPELQYTTANASLTARQPLGPVQFELVGSVSQREGTTEELLNSTSWDTGLTASAPLGGRCGGLLSARMGERQVDFEIVDAITRSLVETQRFQGGVACALPFNITASLTGGHERGRAVESVDQQAQADFDQDSISAALAYQATRRLSVGVNISQTRRELVNPAIVLASPQNAVELTSYTAFLQFNPSTRLQTRFSLGTEETNLADTDGFVASADVTWRLSSRTELSFGYFEGQFQRQDSVALLSDGQNVRVGAQWRPNRRFRVNLEWSRSEEAVALSAIPAGFTARQIREAADVDQYRIGSTVRLTRWADLTLSYRSNSTKARPAIYDLDNDVVQIGISVQR